ncbi:unnamed protein product (mitochondrion) [Plasmodiophora brassicae]|uniref:DNA replication licensing factor MCM3 n=1 Tax=Plasmodiophora brassicae TaxID=37360 RepID=A0A3P3YIF0_PLABS|nr:unnamed protein product [Plasmodiophora brassicae]
MASSVLIDGGNLAGAPAPPPARGLDVNDPEYQANKRMFGELLESETARLNYRSRIQDVIQKDLPRLIVDMNDLRLFRPDIAQRLLTQPMPLIPPFEDALNFVASHLRDDIVKPTAKPPAPLRIGLTGSFGSHRVTPRQLNSTMISSMVCVEGIVTRCSLKFSSQSYTDATSFGTNIRSSPFLPKKDDEGNPLTTEFGLCTYKDHQSITIQEMPERSPPGQMPCSIEVVVDDDLVDTCKPGDRVQIVGVFRALAPSAATGRTTFRTIIVANNVQRIGSEARAAKPLTADDISAITKISKRSDVFELLAKSVSPSIYGHEFIKKAIMLTLIGGAEKNLPNGTHLRGDINMLMVGDPSTAKSQLLRSVLNIAPLAISTTGRGSSGVGLTAAVTQDSETGERRLEAGAMVLADRGVVCIDEFDKMSDGDRTAIHEVMEQQTVTIAKAGIHTSLHARCSVVAAANPIYGQYDEKLPPHKNIGLPDSLLSRFDLLFIVLDQMDPAIDSAIATHVLGLHQFVTSTTSTFDSVDDDADAANDNEGDGTEIFQKYNKNLHGSTTGDVLTSEFLKKYIQYVKAKPAMPKLSTESCDFITEAYSKLRMREDQTLPVTARLLETLIRLSTAHARCRLAKEIGLVDCERALEILQYAMYTEVAAGHGRGEAQDSDVDEGGDDDDDDDDEGRPPLSRVSKEACQVGLEATTARRSRRHRSQEASPSDAREIQASDSMLGEVASPEENVKKPRLQESFEDDSQGERDNTQSSGSALDRQRFNQFQRLLVRYVSDNRLNPCPIQQAIDGVNAALRETGSSLEFTRPEVESYLVILQNQNRVMCLEDEIHFT